LAFDIVDVACFPHVLPIRFIVLLLCCSTSVNSTSGHIAGKASRCSILPIFFEFVSQVIAGIII
jgi:hypothetical protein